MTTTTLKPVTINIPLDPALHRLVRVRAAEEGMTLKAAVIQALDLWTVRQD